MSYQYEDELPPEALARYKAKLRLICLDICPYKLPADKWINNMKDWPNLQYPDLYNYLINFPCVYSTEAMKNYKSLEAYQFFLSGWVQTVQHFHTNTKIFVARADVRPSWRVNDEPHHPWIAVTQSGTVVAGHCDCMAGLGETCSHVGALLYKIEAAVRLGHTATACTDVPCQWNENFTRNVQPQPVSHIKFHKPEAKQRLQAKRIKARTKTIASHSQQQAFLADLAAHGSFVGLSAFADFNSIFVSDTVAQAPDRLPASLRDLYKITNNDKSGHELEALMRQAELQVKSVTAEELTYVEEVTRAQASSAHWYEQRAGRITASTAHGFLHTDPNLPAASLVKQVCSIGKPLSVPAVLWGVDHEDHVYQIYKFVHTGEDRPSDTDIRTQHIGPHQNYYISKSGLVIDVEWPHLGASPDGCMKCDCCGAGVLEIKCPYKHRDSTISEAVEDKNFCLDGQLKLKESHQYYTQVQMQMLVCQADYADLAIWTVKETIIVRVDKNNDFLQQAVHRLSSLWKSAILPELITRSLELAPVPHHSPAPEPTAAAGYCICGGTDEDGMIGCDRCDNWFHLTCLKLKRFPKSKTWYCPACRKVRRSESKKGI